MARTAITVTEALRVGVAQPAVQTGDNVNGMSLAFNDGQIVLELSAVTAETTFEFPVPGLVDGREVPKLEVKVATATPKIVGPFPPGIYNQADGTVSLNIGSANGRLRAYHLGAGR